MTPQPTPAPTAQEAREALRAALVQAFICGDEGPWNDVRACAEEYADEALAETPPALIEAILVAFIHAHDGCPGREGKP